jgi:hypothetical protein
VTNVIEFYTTASQAIKSNPVLAGAFSLWGLTLLTYICKNVPTRIFEFLKRHTVITLSLNNSVMGMNSENYSMFMLWVTPRIIRMRQAMFDTSSWWRFDDVDSPDESMKHRSQIATSFSPGYGNHYFFHKGRLCWFNIKNLDSQGVTFQKREVTVSILFGSLRLLDDILNQFAIKPQEGELNVYQFSDNDWDAIAPLAPRHLDSVITANNLKQHLLTRIDRFLASKEWYETRGIPWKLCILLHGKPGTGKTSLIRALATHYHRSLCFLNMAETGGKRFEQALGKLSKKSFLVLEEIDCSPSTSKRASAKKTKKNSDKDQKTATVVTSNVADVLDEEDGDKDGMGAMIDEMYNMAGGSLSSTLNALDGLMTPSGMIVLATTNHVEKLDPALLRKGRFDVVVEVAALEHADILDYIERAFPGAHVPRGLIFEPILGCDLQDHMLLNSDDADAFIAAIPSRSLRAVNE